MTQSGQHLQRHHERFFSGTGSSRCLCIRWASWHCISHLPWQPLPAAPLPQSPQRHPAPPDPPHGGPQSGWTWQHARARVRLLVRRPASGLPASKPMTSISPPQQASSLYRAWCKTEHRLCTAASSMNGLDGRLSPEQHCCTGAVSAKRQEGRKHPICARLGLPGQSSTQAEDVVKPNIRNAECTRKDIQNTRNWFMGAGAHHGRARRGRRGAACARRARCGGRPRCGRCRLRRRTAARPAAPRKSPGRSLVLCGPAAPIPDGPAIPPAHIAKQGVATGSISTSYGMQWGSTCHAGE